MFWKRRRKDEDHPVLRMCPVCMKHKFAEPFEKCPICNWENDYVQENNPDWRNGANDMSLIEAREAYIQGRTIH